MRPSICQSLLSFSIKLLNYLQTFVGLVVVLFSLWMLNDWNRHGLDKSSAPWFVYTVMSVGVLLCSIALMGYTAAGAVNGCCFCTYAVFTSILILVEAALMADLVFNKHWEEDFPHDATGKLKNLRAFIEANIDIFKWVAVAVVIIQGFSLLLAIIMRAFVPQRGLDDEYDEEFTAARNPLLNSQGSVASASTSIGNTMIQSDSWRYRMRQKYGLVPSPQSNDATTGDSSNDRRKCAIL